jgi:hypothetical protein
MNNELFERLLYEEEGTTLDFKREQYRFARATEDEKFELLKDILGFANAWRRSDAYILIGVEDVRGGQSIVIGISATDHLDDHSLQQFVNNLTNQPVRFHYEAFGFEGKQVGIIRIDQQIRPIYLKRDYGKLLREKVYVRRGSSTDPTKPASLEEIAQMRVGSGQPAAELFVEFAHVERDDALGTNIAWDAECCEMPAMGTIPDFGPPQQRRQFGFDFWSIPLDPMNRPNDNFFRELANFEFIHRVFRPIRLVVRNVGQVAAKNVRAELTVPTNIGVMVMDAFDLPDPPKRYGDPLSNVVQKWIRPAFRRNPGEVGIDKNDERFRVEIDCGDLQPGRRVWSDVFYIGKAASGDLSLCGMVFADNLPQPKGFALTVSVTVTNTVMTVNELCSMPDPAGQGE